MEESVLHIQLVNGPAAGESQRQDGVACGGLDDGAESLVEVNARTLGEATEDPPEIQDLTTQSMRTQSGNLGAWRSART